MSNTNTKVGIGGEYVVKIIDKDGNEHFPFGESPNKNLILDTFFQKIFFGDNGFGYNFGTQAYIQSCRVGDSNIAPNRSQTGIQGNLLATTHRGTAIYDSCDGTFIYLQRDFIFDANSTGSPITYREATVGCFGSNTSGMDITLSRFVFPADVVINSGEQLIILYTLKIGMDALSRNVPCTLTGDGLDFTGYFRMGSTLEGLGLNWTNDLASVVSPSTGTLISRFETNGNTTFLYRTVSSNNLTFSNVSTASTAYRWEAQEQFDIFCMAYLANPPSNNARLGFIPSTAPASTEYTVFPNAPNAGQQGTALGPALANVQRYGYSPTDSGASIILRYLYPAHTSSRTVSGLRIAGGNSGIWGGINIPFHTINFYLRFTEADFTTPRNITIPSGKPVIFNLKWEFVRT
jgi:hypothetical protein